MMMIHETHYIRTIMCQISRVRTSTSCFVFKHICGYVYFITCSYYLCVWFVVLLGTYQYVMQEPSAQTGLSACREGAAFCLGLGGMSTVLSSLLILLLVVVLLVVVVTSTPCAAAVGSLPQAFAGAASPTAHGSTMKEETLHNCLNKCKT